MPTLRTIVALLAVGALSVPLATCGEDDARDSVREAREDVREKAKDIEREIDDLSERDVREALDSMSTKELRAALRDLEREAKQGGAKTKREARELERKIERELDQRR
jgi:hypothetical protein